MAKLLKMAKTKDVPPGQAAPFTIEGQKIALFNVEGTYYAIGDTCTHRGGPLSEVDVFKAPGSPVRGTVRISTSKPSLFWGRQRRRAFQVTKLWSKAMTSQWKYRISVRAVILSLSSYFVFPFVKPGDRLKVGGRVWVV